MSAPQWCRNCRCNVEAEVLEADGFTCCTRCGNVLEDAHFSSDPTFVKTAAGVAQVDGSFVPEEAGAATGLGLAFLGGGRGARSARLQGFNAESQEKTLYKARCELNSLAERLGARPRDELVAAAHRLYKLAVTKNFTRGRRTNQVAGACLYIVCRQENKPYMLIDISDLLTTNVYVLGAVFLQLCQLLRLEQHPIMQRPVDPSLFVPRFADRLRLGSAKSAVQYSALRLVASMKRDWMQTGRRPSGVCGAALYVAAAMHGVPKSKKAVIAAVHIGETTLEKRLNEFEETSTGSMTANEFEGYAIELEARQRQQLVRPAAEPMGALVCMHKDEPGAEHFALGLCRKCYMDFCDMSGGTTGDGNLPPVMLRQQRRENEKRLKALNAPAETGGKDGGKDDAAEPETEYEWEEMMDRAIAMTESRLSEMQKRSGSAPSTSGRPSAAAAGGGGGGGGGAEIAVGVDADTVDAHRSRRAGNGTRRHDVRHEEEEAEAEDQDAAAADDDDENLDDVDVDEYINTEEERQIKQEVWEALNKSWIEKKKAKEAEAAAEASAKMQHATVAEVVEARKVAAEAGLELGTASERMQASGKGSRRRKRATESTTGAPLKRVDVGGAIGTSVDEGGNEIAREEAAARVLLSRKKLSSKINYSALTKLFREEPMHAAKAAPGTEAQRRQQQRERDEHQASAMHLTALQEDARTSTFRKAITGFGRNSFGQVARRRGLNVSSIDHPK